MGRMIESVLAWGFKIRDTNNHFAHRVLGRTSAVWGIGIDLLSSKIIKAFAASVILLCLAIKPRLKSSNDRRKDRLIHYFNSLDVVKRRAIVRRLAYDHVIRSLRRYKRFLENGNGNSFSYLSAISLSIGGECNLHCTNCLMKPFQSPGRAEIRNLDYIFAQAESLGVSFLSIMGAGEPFLDVKYSRELLNCIKRCDSIYFFVYTNGTTMTEELVERADELDNLFFLVSVDGLRDNHEERRGTGTYQKIMEAFQLLRKSSVPFGYSAVVDSDNYHEVTSPAFIQTIADAGALIGVYNQACSIFNSGNKTFTRDSKEKREYLNLIDHVSKTSPIYITDLFTLEEKRYGCRAKKGTSCFIDAVSGKVSPCFLFPFSSDNSNIYERRSDSRLEDILRGEFFTCYRQDQCKRHLCIRDVDAELDYLLSNAFLCQEDRATVKHLKEVLQ